MHRRIGITPARLPRQALASLLVMACLSLGILACREETPDAPASDAIAPASERQRRSIVLIVLDTVRADHLGSYGYERDTSPEFDQWAARGALFEQAIASSSWTLPSFASIYTGQHPGRHGAGEYLDREAFQIAPIESDLPTLAEVFQAAGHATIAYANNPFLHEKFGVARGFDEYSFVPASNQNIRSAAKTVDLALGWLDRGARRPFFMMMHFFDPHMDYQPDAAVQGTFTRGYAGALGYPVTGGSKIRRGLLELDDADRAYIAGSYDEEILATDRALGRFLDGIEARGLLEEAVVIVTSDHGEELFDHGSFEHGHSAYQELMRVPLLILGAGIEPARIPHPVSHVDLFPSALDAAGLDVPADLPGLSLVDVLARDRTLLDRPILADRTLHGRRHRVLIRWPWKAIDVEGRTASMLFHLERDPLEQNDLASAEAARLEAMLKEFEAHSPTRDRSEREREAVALDDAILRQLEALGYAQPGADTSAPAPSSAPHGDSDGAQDGEG